MLAFLVFMLIVLWQLWVMWIPISDFIGISDRGRARVLTSEQQLAQLENDDEGFSVESVMPTVTIEPTQMYVVLVTPTAQPVVEFDRNETPQPLVDYSNYEKQMLVGRFSNYWPPYGGTNCFSDCEHFADGTRVDAAILEGQRVLACPRDWLLGTKFEYPPNSGLVWICRDYGDDIFSYVAESGMTIYWFDFLSENAFVDYGSYIQLQVYIPVSN